MLLARCLRDADGTWTAGCAHRCVPVNDRRREAAHFLEFVVSSYELTIGLQVRIRSMYFTYLFRLEIDEVARLGHEAAPLAS